VVNLMTAGSPAPAALGLSVIVPVCPAPKIAYVVFVSVIVTLFPLGSALKSGSTERLPHGATVALHHVPSGPAFRSTTLTDFLPPHPRRTLAGETASQFTTGVGVGDGVGVGVGVMRCPAPATVPGTRLVANPRAARSTPNPRHATNIVATMLRQATRNGCDRAGATTAA
jgi:hypothetical protein